MRWLMNRSVMTKLMAGVVVLLGMLGLLAYQSVSGLNNMSMALNHWDEAVAYTALYALVSGFNQHLSS